MPKLTITVFLSPNDQFTDNPDPSWPKPQGVTLRLTNKADKKKTVDLAATDSEGVARHDGLAPGDTYTVTILDAHFNVWATADEVLIGADDTEKDVILVPAKGQWLLPLQLCRYDGNGKPIEIPGAKWSYEYGHKKPPAPAKAKDGPFEDRDDGYVYAALWPGVVTLSFLDETVADVGLMKPQSREIKFHVPESREVEVTQVQYLADTEVEASPLGRMSIEPLVKTVAGAVSLTGASATIEYTTESSPQVVSPPKKLGPNEKKIWFNDLLPGIYGATLIPPATFNNWPVAQSEKLFIPQRIWPGIPVEHQHTFKFETITVSGRVQAMDGRLVDDVRLEIYGSEKFKILAVKDGTFEVQLDWGVPLKIRLARNDEISIDGIPLKPEVAEQPLSLTQANVVVIPFKYGVKGQAVDEAGNPAPGAVIDVFNDQQESAGSVAAGPDGYFVVGTPDSGSYYVAPHTDGGEPVTRQLVPVRSIGNAGKVMIPSGRTVRAETRDATPDGGDGDGGGGGDGRRRTREAITDLAAYPVLTEEVSTTGPPAPVAGGFGGSTAGAGYGQAVDQVIRDVLGWRPSGDVAGFQTALAGAFQLRDVEGHTEWTWQQRGYAVQADMGALTGAQASIYARARAALDQIQPLLAGVTALNPTLYPPEDLEAIRTVIATELAELVSELALEGGPRIQRVDELFRLLVGESRKSSDPNPDHVQGQFGTMRARFGLTEEWVDTIDQERILTNFRVVVEQVLSLQESWFYDRDLLRVVDSRSSLGTILIWLSRGLEAVCESVDDLSFSLDSVYVDAAQRQVIELNLPGQDAPILLSDLLDWVVRAARNEGPRLIQDAGRDGVDAFAPVLQELQTLVQDSRTLISTAAGAKLPDGMRTPRVKRAFQVLEAQLIEASRLAGLVQRQPYAQAPQLSGGAQVEPGARAGEIRVVMTGVNFRKPASAFLLPANREDIADVPARHTHVRNPSSATATFRIPRQWAGVAWQIAIANDDGTQSDPVDITIKPADLTPAG